MNIVIAAGLSCVLTVAPSSDAVDRAAQARSQADEAWEREDWDAAAEAFGRAFELQPGPVPLWGQAQALRRAGRCDAAVPLYEAFVELSSEDADRVAARQNIAECKVELSKSPPPVGATPGSPPSLAAPKAEQPPKRTPDGTPADTPAQPPRRDRPSLALMAGGGAVAAVGVGLFAAGQGLARRAETRSAATEQLYRGRVETARRLAVAGVVVASVGLTAVVVGIVRHVRRRPSAKPLTTSLRGVRF